MSKQMTDRDEFDAPVVPPPDPGDPLAKIDPELVDKLLEQAGDGVELLGPDGLLSELTKSVLERALDAELTDHLGYERGDPAGHGSGNSRNGASGKTVHTDVGSVRVDVPRDRNGTFEPAIVPKGQTRLQGFNDRIIALYARGMTVRDIQAHLHEIYGVEVSPDLISKVTAAVIDELREWQNRPLERVYAAIFLDAIRCKVRHEGRVVNKAAYLAVGMDSNGAKDVLGIWIDASEGAKFWLAICNELRNRGVEDVIFVCCDGLTGLPDAIESVWPHAIVQTCIVHLVRSSMRFVSYKDRKLAGARMKEIYRAANEEQALQALERLDEAYGARYPAMVATWRTSWEQFTPMLAFPPEVRRVLYTTNLIESINYQLRKITRNRGHFPSDDALLKLLYLGVRNHLARRPSRRTQHQGEPQPQTNGWKAALNQFEILWPGRLDPR